MHRIHNEQKQLITMRTALLPKIRLSADLWKPSLIFDLWNHLKIETEILLTHHPAQTPPNPNKIEPVRSLRTFTFQQTETPLLLLLNAVLPAETAGSAIQDPGGGDHRAPVQEDNRIHIGDD